MNVLFFFLRSRFLSFLRCTRTAVFGASTGSNTGIRKYCPTTYDGIVNLRAVATVYDAWLIWFDRDVKR